MIPVNVLGFCQGHSEVAKDPTDYGLRRVVLGMHKRLQDMHIGIENLTQQHAYALGMPNGRMIAQLVCLLIVVDGLNRSERIPPSRSLKH